MIGLWAIGFATLLLTNMIEYFGFFLVIFGPIYLVVLYLTVKAIIRVFTRSASRGLYFLSGYALLLNIVVLGFFLPVPIPDFYFIIKSNIFVAAISLGFGISAVAAYASRR